MSEILERGTIRLSNRRLHGRAINAVADLLRRQLAVPNIYLEPRITGVPVTDVLAVDRAGSGDLHAVEIKTISMLRSRAELRDILVELKGLPYHYKYLALPMLGVVQERLRFAEYPELFDESGIGRIGIISFDGTMLDSSSFDPASAVKLELRPERFRVRGESLAKIEKFLAKSQPDMAVRI